jgi:hypothetical protein
MFEYSALMLIPLDARLCYNALMSAQAAPRNFCSSDQQKSYKEISDSSTAKNVPAPPSAGGTLPAAALLPREQWTSFGDGWWQLTAGDSGKRVKYGLHCVIESNVRRAYVCCYEPHIPEVYNAVMNNFPHYDIEVSIKAMKTAADKGGDFCLLLGFQSALKYLFIKCDTERKVWTMAIRCEDGDVPLAVIPMDALRCNCFYDLLLQVRGDTISLDVNRAPLFTAVRIPEHTSIGGLVGVLAVDAKFAMKSWRFRALSAPARRRPAPAPPSPASGGRGGARSGNSFGSRAGDTGSGYAPAGIAGAVYPSYPGSGNRNSGTPASAFSQEQDGYGQRQQQPPGSPGSTGAEAVYAPRSPDVPPPRKPGVAKSLSELMGMNASAPAAAPPPAPAVEERGSRPPGGQSGGQASMASFILNAGGPVGSPRELRPPAASTQASGQARYQQPQQSQYQQQANTRYAGSSIGGGVGSQEGGLVNVRNKYLGLAGGGGGGGGGGGEGQQTGRVEYSDRAPPPPPSQEEVPVLSPIEQTFREATATLLLRHDKNVVDTVMRDVIQRDLGVTFEDIAAVPVAKRLLHEAVILPLIMPEFFTGIREPWKGVLLFGPPGTGVCVCVCVCVDG